MPSITFTTVQRIGRSVPESATSTTGVMPRSGSSSSGTAPLASPRYPSVQGCDAEHTDMLHALPVVPLEARAHPRDHGGPPEHGREGVGRELARPQVAPVRGRPRPSGRVRTRPRPSGRVRTRPRPSGRVRTRPRPSGRVRTRPDPRAHACRAGRPVPGRLSPSSAAAPAPAPVP